MSGSLPQGWQLAPLGTLGTYVNGRAFKPTEWETRGLPIIRIQNLNNSTAEYNLSSKRHETRYKVRHGDLLVAWSASLGAYIWKGQDAWLNQHIFRVEPDLTLCTKEFLYYAVQHAISELYDKAHGTGMVHVTKPVFEKKKFPFRLFPSSAASWRSWWSSWTMWRHARNGWTASPRFSSGSGRRC